MLNWTQLYSQTHQFSEGAIAIAPSFVGNVLAIAATTKPEYAESKQIIGYIFQDSGEARKGYALYSGKDILLLALPETSGLTFFPTSYLSDSYTLDIAYTSVGNILESNTAPIPDLILGLPSRVTTLEATDAEHQTYLENISTVLDTLEANATAPSWESITGKPSSFTPSTHGHAIADIDGLGSALTGLADRVEALEETPSSGSLAPVLLIANSTLEGNNQYLATVANLVVALPSSPAIGDVIDIATGDFSLQVKHGNASQQVLNNNTYTSTGADNGIILKPFSCIRLRLCESNLWVSSYRARTINNFTPLSQESVATQKTYTATAPASNYGASIDKMYNGVKTVGGITNGYLSETATGDILITLSESIVIDQIKVWNGQGNVAAGGSSGYRLNDMKVYAGNSVSGESLGTYTFTDTTATEQIKTVTPNTVPSSTFLLKMNSITPNIMGIIELEIWGKGATGGEVEAL